MLHFSRWKAAAILGTTLVVSCAAFTNVLPAATFDALPTWAQRKIALGIDLQGGARYRFRVDDKDVRRMLAERLRDDVRDTLRAGGIGFARLVTRDDGIELLLRDQSDIAQALTLLRKLAGPEVAAGSRATHLASVAVRHGETSVAADRSGHVPPPLADVSSDGRLIRLTLTPAAISERIIQGRNGSISVIEWYLQANGLEFRVAPVGSDRVVVDLPEPLDLSRLAQF